MDLFSQTFDMELPHDSSSVETLFLSFSVHVRFAPAFQMDEDVLPLVQMERNSTLTEQVRMELLLF